MINNTTADEIKNINKRIGEIEFILKLVAEEFNVPVMWATPNSISIKNRKIDIIIQELVTRLTTQFPFSLNRIDNFSNLLNLFVKFRGSISHLNFWEATSHIPTLSPNFSLN